MFKSSICRTCNYCKNKNYFCLWNTTKSSSS